MKLPLVILLVFSLGLSMQSEAVAQSSDDRAAAQALFDEGQRLMAAEKFSEACAKFEASLGLVAGLGSRGRLAQCYEKIGKTASAWAAFRQVADLAKMANDMTRYEAANRFAKELEKKLSYVTFTAKEPVSGMQIFRDGATLAAGVLGTPIAIDPGEHTLEVRAEGYETWTQEFSIAVQENSSVEIPALVASPDAIGSGGLVALGGPTQGSKPSTKTTGLIVGGAGGALVGGALIMAIVADQKWTGAFDDGDCVKATNICNDAGKSATDSARTLSKVSLVMGSVGLAAAAAGTYLWFRGRDQEAKGALTIAPALSDTSAGFAITGSY